MARDGGHRVPSPRARGEVERRHRRRPDEGPRPHRDIPHPVTEATRPLAASGERGASGHVLLGAFGRAHGLKGEVRLKSYTADPLAIAGYGPLATADGRQLVLTHVRQAAGDQPDLLVATVEGVRSREDAEALNRLAVYAARDRLGDPEEDEFFLADLIGMEVRTPAGEEAGRIVDVPNFGGGDLLEIRPRAGGATILVPFTKAFVPLIDVAAGRVLVDVPPEDADTAADAPQS